MISRKLAFEMGKLKRKLWFRPALFSLGAVATVSLAILLPPVLSFSAPTQFDPEAVEKVLTVLASSMLAVVTFSLSALVTALSAAAQSATPRAATLLMEDGGVQNALSTFVGAFLFGVVGIIGISGGIYSNSGRFLLFAATAVVIAVVVVTLVRWIDRITRLGRVGSTIDTVEEATSRAFATYSGLPATTNHAVQLADAHLEYSGIPVFVTKVGYVQHLDLDPLVVAAQKARAKIHLTVRPGAFVDPTRRVAVIDVETLGDLPDHVRAAITVGDARSFDQDPRFGLVVLSEIASRALSPGINDPGTAIDVIGTLVRILWTWQATHQNAADEEDNTCLSVPRLDPSDILEDSFRAIARDGAGTVEVASRLAKALRSLEDLPDADLSLAARVRLADLVDRVRLSGCTESDRTTVESIAAAP
ncbi:putative membrane protein [Rhodoligotrophos appendicifer]|uniref:DUF2254 domain-containing protein n=1 Tax=Rhodoligotrophos appendicifer TaxID=987056 RepID=UPI0011860E3F|nr:DUF2254 domain-containing protein [Rhodoligotrophos appendicifer]